VFEKEKTQVIEVEPMDPEKKCSSINGGLVPEGEGLKGAYCWYNGRRYGEGAIIQQSTKALYTCVDGHWWRLNADFITR
jgi:hypothetical protein